MLHVAKHNKANIIQPDRCTKLSLDNINRQFIIKEKKKSRCGGLQLTVCAFEIL